jgi:hypothetical protein
MKLLGAAKTTITGQDELPGRSNYFIGGNPQKWRTNIPHFARVRYGDVYPGIDLVYYGNQRQLEYDFVLEPGADASRIRFQINGAGKLSIEDGDLVLTGAAGEIRLRRPNVFQVVNGGKREIAGGYVLENKNQVRFRLAPYNRREPLVIDPVLAYSTYLGGSGDDSGIAIAVDSEGNTYLTGSTNSPDFPTVNPIQPTRYATLAFVTKMNADGTALLYSTYLGRSNYGYGAGIAVDQAGNAYVGGGTGSADFPTINAIQPVFGGGADALGGSNIKFDGNVLSVASRSHLKLIQQKLCAFDQGQVAPCGVPNGVLKLTYEV